MTTIETTATVTADGMLLIPLPSSIPEGEHRVVVVIEEKRVSPTKRMPLRFSAYPARLYDDSFTFRREDLYGE